MARTALPPGPATHHPLGQLPLFAKGPLNFLLDLVPYGKISTFRLLHVRCYFLNDPTYVKQVLQDENQSFGKESVDFKVFRNTFGNGLLTSQGEFWLRQRRLAQPSFHKKQVSTFGNLMTQATEELLDTWEQCDQTAIDLWENMRRLALRITGESLFGVDPNHAAVGQEFEVLEQYIIELFQFPLVLPTWVPTPQNQRLTRAHRKLYHLIDTMTTERREHHNERQDLLTMLIEAHDEDGSTMTNTQVRDEIVTMLFAGYETTAASLTWVWYALATYPDVERSLHEELDRVLQDRTPTIDDLPHLVYTRRMIYEVLRMWPPAAFTNRSVLVDTQIAGYSIPKKSIVFVSPYVMQHLPEYWPNPTEFDPNHFSEQQHAERPRFAYFPFGGGPHKCIGEAFALTELTLVVATIASKYQLRFAAEQDEKNTEPHLLPALRPKKLIMMTRKRVFPRSPIV